MENEKSSSEIIQSIRDLLIQLPTITYGSNAIQHLISPNFGNGQAGYDLLKNKFNELDLSKPLEFSDLDKKILRQKKELKDLENKHTNLIEIIGDNFEGREGSIASQILLNLKSEIEILIKTRDELLKEISVNQDLEERRVLSQKEKEELEIESLNEKRIELEQLYNDKEKELTSKYDEKIAEIKSKTNNATRESNDKIKEAETNAIGKVQLINQFRDFLEETNKNMNLYSLVIKGILLTAIIAIGYSIPNLLTIFDSYDTFIKSQGTEITNWQIINYAFGLLIVKLPWALCLSAVLTGIYRLLKGLLLTYEKINQDKRNMSAIYAISGNVAQALNEYGIDLAEDEIENENSDELLKTIKVSKKN